MSKTVGISKPILIIGIVSGLGAILLIGLLSGLVARPKNCVETAATTPGTTQRTTTTPATSTSTSSSSTTTTTTTTPSTSTSTTTTTSTTVSSSSSSSTGSTTTTNQRTTPAVTTPTTPRPTTTDAENSLRIPDYQKPSNYKLRISAFFNPNGETTSVAERFEGSVEITFALTEASSRVVFHSDSSLVFDSQPRLTVKSSGQQVTIQSSSPSSFQRYEIITQQNLATGVDYVLSISYKGDFGSASNIIGFYLSSYSEDGVVKKVAGTKYEPTDARKAFPCFDEPGFKATYDITVEHPANSIALSNWPQAGSATALPNGRLVSTFQTTVPMSTYLAAWAILPKDFSYVESASDKGKPIRVYGRKNAVATKQADFALDVAKKSLDYFENVYFGISEAVPPKIDLIGFPQFPSGAMEHWGLIGFRETLLLYTEDANSILSKQDVALVVAHELAHFWFGNLVTCKWWDEIWLNEAMASFLQLKAIESIFPDWHIGDQFINSNQITAMNEDAYVNTRTVVGTVTTTLEINSAFDTITYNKGSSILRMLESTIGESNFRSGLTNFLIANKFSTGNADDFYNSLTMPSEMAGVTAKQYMDNWLTQINYPSIKIELEDIDASRNRVKFSQERFLFPDSTAGSSPFDFTWKIYMKCRAGGTFDASGDPQQHLTGTIRQFNVYFESVSTTFDLDRKFTWVYCNENFKGYYLNQFSPSIFSAFSEALQINPAAFSRAERANIIHNSFSLAYANKFDYDVPAKIAAYLDYREQDSVPWKTFYYHVNRIATILEHKPGFYGISRYGRSIADYLLSETDVWANVGTHDEILLKISTVDFLCRLQDYSCLTRATAEFKRINPKYFQDPSMTSLNPVYPSWRSSVYKYHIQNSEDAEDSFKMLDLYEYTDDSQERSIALAALNSGRLPWMIDYQLDLLFDASTAIKPQDFFTVIINVSRNPSGRHIGWYFLRYYWDEIVSRFGIQSRTLASAVKSVCDTFDNRYLLLEMDEFFDYTEAGAGALARKQASEQVLTNLFWIDENQKDVEQNLVGPLFRRKPLN